MLRTRHSPPRITLRPAVTRRYGTASDEIGLHSEKVYNYDCLLQVEVADLAAYEDFHASRLASLPGVAMVTSYVTMETFSVGTA